MEKLKKIYDLVSNTISPVYAVGGCVRDTVLGIEAKDYDFCTPLLPDEIEALIKKSGRKAYLVGKKFGTIGFKVEIEPTIWEYVEVTTFRQETYNKQTRKPEVNFIKDLKDDVFRRDFTINSLAYDGSKIIDYFGGVDDINNKIIKCINQPKIVFSDDPLRMLRAARFASQLGFQVEEYTEKKAKECSFMLYKVSKERWCLELDKILMSDNPRIGLNFLMKTRVLHYLIPELALQEDYDQNSKYHDFSLWEHTLKVIENTPKDLMLRWSALLHDIGKPFAAVVNKKSGYTNYVFHERIGAEIVLKYALYFKWSNEQKNKVIDIVYKHLKDDSILRPYDIKGHKLESK